MTGSGGQQLDIKKYLNKAYQTKQPVSVFAKELLPLTDLKNAAHNMKKDANNAAQSMKEVGVNIGQMGFRENDASSGGGYVDTDETQPLLRSTFASDNVKAQTNEGRADEHDDADTAGPEEMNARLTQKHKEKEKNTKRKKKGDKKEKQRRVLTFSTNWTLDRE